MCVTCDFLDYFCEVSQLYDENGMQRIFVKGSLYGQMTQDFMQSGHEVIKLFSCSIQLSTRFQLLIKTKILTYEEVSCFKYLRCCIYHAYKC